MWRGAASPRPPPTIAPVKTASAETAPEATQPEARSAPLPDPLAAALVFLASGAALVLEIVALRLVGPYVGVTLETSSAVIGVTLAAIAYGTWIGGRVADRRDPRRLLGPALLLAGIATAITLPVVRYAGEALRGAATGGVLLLTALAVVVSAALLSAVTPLVVKLQLGDVRRTGRVVGRLSSIGTLGGITATLGTGFILVAALPSSTIIIGLAALLGVTGIALDVYLRRQTAGGPRGRGPGALAAAGLVAAGLAAVAPTPCDVETAYHCASVVADPQRPSGRVLLLNSAQHSYVDLDDPTHLEFAYVQWIGAVTDVVAPPGQPLDVVHLGGGGFTVPRYLTATRPGTRNVVFEIDGELVALGRRELGVREGDDLRIAVGDARMLVAAHASASADVVVGDAFGHLVVPWHLTTREMMADLRRILRPEGTYVQNVIDYPPARFLRAELATVAAEFPHVALVAPPAAIAGDVGANFLILASQRPLPLDTLRARLEQLPQPVTVLTGADLTAFMGAARVLTDDFAPVDQLLVRP